MRQRSRVELSWRSNVHGLLAPMHRWRMRPPSWISLGGGSTRRGYERDRVWEIRSKISSSNWWMLWNEDQKSAVNGASLTPVVQYSVRCFIICTRHFRRVHREKWPTPTAVPPVLQDTEVVLVRGFDLSHLTTCTLQTLFSQYHQSPTHYCVMNLETNNPSVEAFCYDPYANWDEKAMSFAAR